MEMVEGESRVTDQPRESDNELPGVMREVRRLER